VEASIQFYQRLDAPAKELKIYEGFLHELHNERGRAGVLEDYLAWIEKTIPLANPSAEPRAAM
jgi:alpha-beta hydrolase superfamily lysophospholipase